MRGSLKLLGKDSTRIASDKHSGPVKEGELPGEFTSRIARVGWTTAAAAAGAGPPASGVLASASLLFRASSTRLLWHPSLTHVAREAVAPCACPGYPDARYDSAT